MVNSSWVKCFFRLFIVSFVPIVVTFLITLMLLFTPGASFANNNFHSENPQSNDNEFYLIDPPVSFTVSTIYPYSNTLGIISDTSIGATFNKNLDISTVNTNTFRIRGNQSGFYNGSFSFPSLESLDFDSRNDFKPGEIVYVTASSYIQSNLGDSLCPYHWMFSTEVDGGCGSMVSHSAFGGGNSFGLDIGDLDGDGDLDAVVANFSGQPQHTWLNNINDESTSQSSSSSFGEGDSTSVALGDLDNDGDLDAVVTNYYDQAQTVWVNNGSGSFSPHSTPKFGSNHSRDVALGDLDGDGDLDAVVANDINQPQTVWTKSTIVSPQTHS